MSTVIKGPVEVSDLDMTFPTGIENILPAQEVIPVEFFQDGNLWLELAKRWFYDGLPQSTLYVPKADVDLRKALRHLRAVLGAFHCGYAHKLAAAAYLMSCWFERIDPDADVAPPSVL